MQTTPKVATVPRQLSHTTCTCRHIFRKRYSSALHGKPVVKLRSVTCHMGLHSITYYSTKVNALHLNDT